MPSNSILVGSAGSVRRALEALPTWQGVVLRGVALVGDGDDVASPILVRAATWETLDAAALPADDIILAEPPTQPVTRLLLARATECGKRLFINDEGALRPLRLDDLIGRPLGKIDWTGIAAAIANKRILITGGGGSIGSELARKISALGPSRLTLLDSSEYNLFKIGLELPEAVPILADVRDAAAMRRWLARERPDIVFHAAALKQVPMVEAFPSEGVLTNVCGVRHVAEAAHAAGADVIFVSTDKAVEPSGVMGATKRLGELYCRALDRRGPRRTIAVRLGNVLGSTGSVTPVFDAQLKAGGPLTVTDPQVTRFFMSIPQAAKALLQAGVAGLDKESPRGAVFAIDMGDALPVVDLAREMIRLAGLRPDEDVSITFTGLRPGEKLHELLIASDEWREAAALPGIMAVASQPRGLAELHEAMDRLALLAQQGADAALVKELFAAIESMPIIAPRATAATH